MIVLAIDQGTSGTKALLHDGEHTLAVVEAAVRPTYAGEAVEVDPEQLWTTVLETGRQAIAEAGNPAVDAISIANQGETVLAWDPVSGRPLGPAMVWQDRRAEEICRGLSEHASLIAERTGLVLDSYFSAPKMAYLRREVTQGVVTTTDTWLVHRLTGEFVTDATTAGRSLLVDVDALEWDAELAGIFGLAGERLPRIVANDETVGHTDAFGGSVPVGGLIVDQQAALAAQRCLDPGSAKCTFGTGAFVLANTGDRAVRSMRGLTTSPAWSLRDRKAYCLDGQVYTAGSAVRWMVSAGLLSSPEALDAEAAGDPGGAVFVPGLAGLAAPWWTSSASGAFLGMGLATERGHLVRAVIEGLASQVAVLVGELVVESGTELGELRVDGGLTRSGVLMQAQADLLQIPIECYPSPHATALGAAAMARLSQDSSMTLETAVPQWEPSRVYQPRWPASRAAEVLGRWRECVDVLAQQEKS